jgi:hypothetical protein
MNPQNTSRKSLQIGNIIAYVAVLTINILSSALPLDGLTAGKTPDSLPAGHVKKAIPAY